MPKEASAAAILRTPRSGEAIYVDDCIPFLPDAIDQLRKIVVEETVFYVRLFTAAFVIRKFDLRHKRRVAEAVHSTLLPLEVGQPLSCLMAPFLQDVLGQTAEFAPERFLR